MEALTLISTLFAGLSTGLSFFQHFSKTTRYEELKVIKEKLDKNYIIDPVERVENELLHWLAYSDLILPHLKKRITARLLIALFYIFASTATILSISELDIWYYIAVGVSQIMVAFIPSDIFLKTEEKDFITNLNLLNELFYKKEVLPAIGKFNTGVADSLGLIKSNDQEKLSSEEKNIKKFIDKFFKPGSGKNDSE